MAVKAKVVKGTNCCASDSQNAELSASLPTRRQGNTRKEKASGRIPNFKLGHPDHSDAIKKLNRVIGQLQGIQRMITENRYCPDIIIQTRAAASALKAIELTILKKHLNFCVTNAMRGTNKDDAEDKIREILELFTRY